MDLTAQDWEENAENTNLKFKGDLFFLNKLSPKEVH